MNSLLKRILQNSWLELAFRWILGATFIYSSYSKILRTGRICKNNLRIRSFPRSTDQSDCHYRAHPGACGRPGADSGHISPIRRPGRKCAARGFHHLQFPSTSFAGMNLTAAVLHFKTQAIKFRRQLRFGVILFFWRWACRFFFTDNPAGGVVRQGI